MKIAVICKLVQYSFRERYRQDREKRLRADGTDPYLEVTGEFVKILEDRRAEAEMKGLESC